MTVKIFGLTKIFRSKKELPKSHWFVEKYAVACCKQNSNPFNIHEKYLCYLNIPKSKIERFHMKCRQTKLKKDYLWLNSPTGKNADVIKNEEKWNDKKQSANQKTNQNTLKT